MKNIFLWILAFVCIHNAAAQQKNPTTTKEMQDKIKQAQQQLDKLTPEQRKMMEQMGMSTTVPSMLNGITDADVKAAVNGDAFSVPSKNTMLIAAISKITVTTATLPSYIKSLNDYIEKGISNDAKIFAQQVYATLKANQFDAASIGNASLGYWTIGNLEIAVYIMGRACTDNTTDADLLSNFTAMLSMGGAPHRAIPLLEYLNKQYPGNTTILNNLGQAWFYLGETDKANEQLNKVVKAFAYHPQANYTQCLIEQSKGNTPKAIEKMKNSIAYSYSLDKLNMLRKLGYKVKGSDMRIPFRPDPDPLGLKKFIRPDVPMSYADELRLSADWDAFQKQVNEKSMQLAKDLIPYQQANNQKAQQAYEKFAGKSAGQILQMKSDNATESNLYQATAQRNLEEMNKDGGVAYRLKVAKKQIDNLIKDFTAKDEAQRKSFEKQNSIKAEQETELAKKGENLGYDNCVVQQKYSDWVYTNYNKPLEEAYKNYLHQLYLKITEELYWEQFVQEEATFEATKIAAKKEWLAALGNTRYIATNKYGDCKAAEKKTSKYKLVDFDDMHCIYKSMLDFRVCTMIFECGKSSISFDAGRLSGNFHFKSDNTGKERFVKGTMEATVIDKSVSAGKGPLQVGASVKAGMGIEFTNRGIEDVYATGEAKVTAGSNTVSDPAGIVSDPSVSITVSGRMSLISGNMSGGISGFGK
ncbi:tetratricopeptide repeat protein [Niabella beijingensis]|uniref:tetratricopeptide repeat protein n=1 Tax=Niabella beijingensis TaxID=2872700 RepID=UPI001CBE2B99|nr:hypothetical protein [Niabella beijingensis]MBZ4191586.1 hypothetical protein [Niabella beijingensis]